MQLTDATTMVSRRVSRACRGRVAQPVDLVVDRRVLLDVGVAGRDVRLGLVVVVVADEVLDPVVGEELAHLLGQLRGQRLVGRQDQRGSLDVLDRPRDGGALAGARDAEQRLEPVAALQTLGQLGDGLRLVTGSLEVGDHAERFAGECRDRHGDHATRCTSRGYRCSTLVPCVWPARRSPSRWPARTNS